MPGGGIRSGYGSSWWVPTSGWDAGDTVIGVYYWDDENYTFVVTSTLAYTKIYTWDHSGATWSDPAIYSLIHVSGEGGASCISGNVRFAPIADRLYISFNFSNEMAGSTHNDCKLIRANPAAAREAGAKPPPDPGMTSHYWHPAASATAGTAYDGSTYDFMLTAQYSIAGVTFESVPSTHYKLTTTNGKKVDIIFHDDSGSFEFFHDPWGSYDTLPQYIRIYRRKLDANDDPIEDWLELDSVSPVPWGDVNEDGDLPHTVTDDTARGDEQALLMEYNYTWDADSAILIGDICAWNDRLVVAERAEDREHIDRLYLSKPGVPDAIDGIPSEGPDWEPVGRGDGDVLKMLKTSVGNLAIFMDNAIWELMGQDVSTWQFIERTKVSIINGQAVAAGRGGFYFLGPAGFMLWTGTDEPICVSAGVLDSLFSNIAEKEASGNIDYDDFRLLRRGDGVIVGFLITANTPSNGDFEIWCYDPATDRWWSYNRVTAIRDGSTFWREFNVTRDGEVIAALTDVGSRIYHLFNASQESFKNSDGSSRAIAAVLQTDDFDHGAAARRDHIGRAYITAHRSTGTPADGALYVYYRQEHGSWTPAAGHTATLGTSESTFVHTPPVEARHPKLWGLRFKYQDNVTTLYLDGYEYDLQKGV